MVALSQWMTSLFSGSTEATENKRNDTQLAEDQKTKWDQDRSIVGGEWSGLLSEYPNPQFAPRAILQRDPFETMSHQEIYSALEGVDAGAINAKADGWRNLSNDVRDANKAFTDGVTNTIDQYWDGASGRAAVEGTRAFATELTALAASFQMVAHGLDLIEGHLAQAKNSVGKPDNVTIGDKIVSALPMQNVLKGPEYRANEAQETARWVMTTYYRPGAEDVDSKTPVLPQLKNPVEGSNPTDQSWTPQGTTTPSGTTPGNPSTQPGLETTDQQPGQENPGDRTTPQSTTSESTTPASTTTPTTTGAPTTENPRTTTPGLTTGTPTTPGLNTPGRTTGTPTPGRSVPGTPGTAAAPKSTTAATNNANRAGRMGMPGMMSPGARGGRDDDETEHKTPDYLVYERESELIGDIPPALPPGGVIGG